jgi:hypothetical protein
MRRCPAAVFAFALMAGMCASPPTRADDTVALPVDWGKLGALLRHGADALQPREPGRPEAQDRNESGRFDGGVADTPPWLGTALRVSLVARDWGASQVLWGHLSLTDQMRLTRSTRMVVSRVRFANGRIAPFGQLGLGQWRIDQSVLPTLPGDAHPAAQVGGGFEFELVPHATIAVEGDCTMLYRESREPEALAVAQVASALLAARASF